MCNVKNLIQVGNVTMIENYLWEQLSAVAKYGTLSEASKNLYITQPALSRSMKKLEKIIGVELFTRRKNFLALNENGKLAAELAENILQQNRAAVEKIRDFDRKNHTIFIGCCAPLPMNKLIFILRQKFPDVSISSELNNDKYLLKNLKNDLFNLIILHENPVDDELFVKKFGSEKLFLRVPQNHKFAAKKGIYLDELNGEKILLYSKIGFWYDLCKDKAPTAKFLMQDERETFKELVSSSAFLSFTTDFFIKNGYVNKNCLFKPILDEEADVNYYCACKKINRKLYAELFDKLDDAKDFNGIDFIL